VTKNGNGRKQTNTTALNDFKTQCKKKKTNVPHLNYISNGHENDSVHFK
jgi:hypothetical protein